MSAPAESVAAPPRLARAADAASALLVAIAAWIAVTGGSRHVVLDIVVGLRSPLLFLYVAASIQIVRHVVVPSPVVWVRLARGWRAAMSRPGVSAAVRPFVATRAAVLLAGFFAVVAIGIQATPGFSVSDDPLTNLPARFDAGWYGAIALDGYHWDHQFQRQRNIAFFPALPLMMRAAGVVLGAGAAAVPRERRMRRTLWGGVLVSLAAFLGGLWYLARVGEDLLGAERAASAVLLLAAYPFSLFYSAPYAEGLFLLGAVGAVYHFRREEWAAASLLGLLAGLSRPNGCLMSVPLGILACQHGWHRMSARGGTVDAAAARALATRLGVAAMPGVGMLLFTAYLYRLTGGVWFAWARSHEAWGRTFEGLAPVAHAIGSMGGEPLRQVAARTPFNALNTLGLLFALALIVPVFRKLGLAWGAFVAVNLALPLLAGGVLSVGRLSSTLFPLFLALAAVVPSRSVPSWAAAFGIMQGLCAALFFTWRDLF